MIRNDEPANPWRTTQFQKVFGASQCHATGETLLHLQVKYNIQFLPAHIPNTRRHDLMKASNQPRREPFKMNRLSSPLHEMADHYTVVVVGSGYGGAIAASRMARAGQRVCLLERGKEIHPGEYPNTKFSAWKNMQFDSSFLRMGSRTGLYDFRINKEISVFVGCGLGGTSLVNANVALRADPRVFENERWPKEIRWRTARTWHALCTRFGIPSSTMPALSMGCAVNWRT